MWSGRALRRADCVSGACFALLGVGVLWQASQMPIGGTYGGVDNPWYVSPAAVPLLVGLAMVLSGIAVSVRGWRAGAGAGLGGALVRAVKRLLQTPARRGVIVVAILSAYFLLVKYPWLPGVRGENYIVTSACFLAAFALAFRRPGGAFPNKFGVIGILLGSVAIAWAVALLFSGPLRVPLP